VASRPIDDFDAYRQRLQQFVYHSGTLMKRIFAAARTVAPERSRIILCEGEDERGSGARSAARRLLMSQSSWLSCAKQSEGDE
jgi:hypothetical protein